jgi:hypothetical protein
MIYSMLPADFKPTSHRKLETIKIFPDEGNSKRAIHREIEIMIVMETKSGE